MNMQTPRCNCNPYFQISGKHHADCSAAPKASGEGKCCEKCGDYSKKIGRNPYIEPYCVNPICECHTPSSESWGDRFDASFWDGSRGKDIRVMHNSTDNSRIALTNDINSFIQKEFDAVIQKYEADIAVAFDAGRAEGKSLCLKEVREAMEKEIAYLKSKI